MICMNPITKMIIFVPIEERLALINLGHQALIKYVKKNQPKIKIDRMYWGNNKGIDFGIKPGDADIFALSIVDPIDILKVEPMLKEFNLKPTTLTMAGGFAFDDVLIGKDFDIVFAGDELENLNKTLTAFLKGGKIKAIEKANSLQNCFCPSFQSKPKIFFKKHRLPQYITGSIFYKEDAALLPTMGCKRNCNFCVFSQRGFSEAPKKEVTRKLEEFFKRRVKSIIIHSANITQCKTNIFKIIYKLQQKYAYKPIIVVGSFRLDEINKQLLDDLSKLNFCSTHDYHEGRGTKSLALAPESGSDRIIKKFNKGFTTKDALDAIKLISNYVRYVVLYFIESFPDSTSKDLDKTINFIKEIKQNTTAKLELKFTPFFAMPLTSFSNKQNANVNEYKKAKEKLKQLEDERTTCEFLDEDYIYVKTHLMNHTQDTNKLFQPEIYIKEKKIGRLKKHRRATIVFDNSLFFELQAKLKLKKVLDNDLKIAEAKNRNWLAQIPRGTDSLAFFLEVLIELGCNKITIVDSCKPFKKIASELLVVKKALIGETISPKYATTKMFVEPNATLLKRFLPQGKPVVTWTVDNIFGKTITDSMQAKLLGAKCIDRASSIAFAICNHRKVNVATILLQKENGFSLNKKDSAKIFPIVKEWLMQNK